ncbi:type 4 pilus major pilin [Halodesulfovibrio sp.]|jgi:type II secretory pathway pseudopilin PulG|uniref:type 4 pilus major pilin n=1 Tax=Halodesulfovibrio sp. TaxID=1912772 RepID=UPI0025D7E885|nr:type 4 pilus major pilin [Halodesulfovibrio sp.]MCT4625662.1 pilus assembly protein PilS [Halodesulfovibrio sp.]
MFTPEEQIKHIENYEDLQRRQGGWTMVEIVIALIIGLVALASIGLGVASALENMKIGDTESEISTLRMQTKQLYKSSPDYTGLNNAIAEKAGVIPDSMLKSNGIRNSWNGNVSVVTGDDPNTFVLTLEAIPLNACVKLATFQNGSWKEVSVNGSSISQDNIVSEAAGQCDDENTLAFTSD